jgi:signal transduction histidine kinase
MVSLPFSAAAGLDASAGAARSVWLRRYPGVITEDTLEVSLALLVAALSAPPGSGLSDDLRSPRSLLLIRRELVDLLRLHFVAGLAEEAAEVGSAEALVDRMARFEEIRTALEPSPDEQIDASLAGPRAHEILAEVGHDLRSPLTSVLFLAEALRDAPGIRENDQQVRQLGMIYSGAITMLNVVNNFMEFARSGAGPITAEPTMFSVEDLLEATRRTLQPVADGKGLRLSVRMELQGSDRRRGHLAVLSRVLLNLASNALKFTESGDVRFHAREWEPGVVEMAVEDTGPGISPEQQEAILNVFEPAQDRHGVRFSSSGLGLVIVQRLLRGLHSELVCDSRVGAGTRMAFRVHLPTF